MMRPQGNLVKWFYAKLVGEYGSLALLFGFEGLVVQFITSVHNCSTNLYATYLGATDSQLGFVSMSYNLVTLLALIPVGIISNKMKSSRNLLITLSFAMGGSYIGLAFIPALVPEKMAFYFVFVGLALGSLSTYNAQWQAFFGDVVVPAQRNDI